MLCWWWCWCYVYVDVMFLGELRVTPSLLVCTRLERLEGLRCTYWLVSLILLRGFNGARFTEATSNILSCIEVLRCAFWFLACAWYSWVLRGFDTLQTSWHAHDFERAPMNLLVTYQLSTCGTLEALWVMLIREDQWGSRVLEVREGINEGLECLRVIRVNEWEHPGL